MAKHGQTLVEFALICLPFFIILFALIDFAEIFFYENAMQNALRESCRFATAGSIIPKRDANGNPIRTNSPEGVSTGVAIDSKYGDGESSRNECIRDWFHSNCALQNVPDSNIVIVSASTLPGAHPTTTTNDLGQVSLLSANGGAPVRGPGNYNDYIQISANIRVSTITPLMGYMSGYGGFASSFPVHVSAVVKNEPALQNFEHIAIYTNEP